MTLRGELKMIDRMLKCTVFAAGVTLAASAQAETLIIQHDFISPGERRAITVLKNTWEKGGDKWNDLTMTHDSGSTVTLSSLLAGGNPPDIFFSAEPGTYADLKQEGRLLDLGPYFQTEKGKAAFAALPEFLQKFVTIDGEQVRAPNSVHIDGVMCYNLAVAKKTGVDPSTWKSFDDFYKDFDKVKGNDVIPLAFGADSFQIGYLFHSLVAAVDGGVYDRVFGVKADKTAIDTKEMREAFDLLRGIQKHTDAGATGRQWNEATNMVISGRALFQIQGDWMTGEWRAAGKTDGKDFSCVPLPGAKGATASVNTWGFVDTKNESKKEAQYRYLDANFDPEQMTQFNLEKGSTPPRRDVDLAKFPPWTQHALKLFDQPGFVHLTPRATIDQDWMRGIYDVASQFWANPDMTSDQAVEALQSSYDQVF